jgi:hypothetical protein
MTPSPGLGSVAAEYFVKVGHNNGDSGIFPVALTVESTGGKPIASALPKKLVLDLCLRCFHNPSMEEGFVAAFGEDFGLIK